MLLRRLMLHVKEQNWFAVGLDFLIVVVGVFIGIQVSNWNDARRDRQAESIYLDRLGREIAEISPQAEASHETVRGRLERIVEVRNFFATGEGENALGGEHCAGLGTSHIFAGTIFYPPTIKELIATGRIVLIRDDATRTAILSFDQTNAELSQLRTDIQIDRLPLARAHPGLIDSGLASWEDSFCDFKAMARDQTFLNDFTDNMRRFDAYVTNVMGRQFETLKSLGVTVASGLPRHPMNASVHGDQTSPIDKPESTE
jgi:hypothetical protein